MQGQTGSYVTTTLVTPPASSALTTLENVRDELSVKDGDTSNDARFTRYINEESAGLARYCGRIFGLATWQDVFRLSRGVWGEGVREANNPLKLTKYPLAGPSVSFTGNTHSNKLVDGIASTGALATGQPLFGSGIPAGTTISRVLPYSLILSAAATSTAAGVSLTTGISVVETVCGVDTVLVYGTDYEVDTGSRLPGDEGASRLYRLNEFGRPRTWSADKVTVIYQAGYALPNDTDDPSVVGLPPDIATACLRLVVMRFRMRGRDPTLVERGQPGLVGSERYWIGTIPGQKGAYPPDIQELIDQYRGPTLA